MLRAQKPPESHVPMQPADDSVDFDAECCLVYIASL